MSHRSPFLGGNDGFQRIPDMPKSNSNESGGDATVEIPLTSVYTNKSSQRKMTGLNEKIGEHKTRKGGRRRPGQYLRSNDVEGINGMGRMYRKVLRSSIIVRYFLYIIPIGAILTVPIVIGAIIRNPDPPGIGNVRIIWIFAWALTMWVALWAAKLFAKMLPYIFEFFCGIVSPSTRHYSTIIKALEIPISIFLWALASLATFKPVSIERLVLENIITFLFRSCRIIQAHTLFRQMIQMPKRKLLMLIIGSTLLLGFWPRSWLVLVCILEKRPSLN